MQFAPFQPAPDPPDQPEIPSWSNVRGYGEVHVGNHTSPNPVSTHTHASLHAMPSAEYLHAMSVDVNASPHPFDDGCCRAHAHQPSHHHCARLQQQQQQQPQS